MCGTPRPDMPGPGKMKPAPEVNTRTRKILRARPERVGYHRIRPGSDYPDKPGSGPDWTGARSVANPNNRIRRIFFSNRPEREVGTVKKTTTLETMATWASKERARNMTNLNGCDRYFSSKNFLGGVLLCIWYFCVEPTQIPKIQHHSKPWHHGP